MNHQRHENQTTKVYLAIGDIKVEFDEEYNFDQDIDQLNMRPSLITINRNFKKLFHNENIFSCSCFPR